MCYVIVFLNNSLPLEQRKINAAKEKHFPSKKRIIYSPGFPRDKSKANSTRSDSEALHHKVLYSSLYILENDYLIDSIYFYRSFE